MPTVYSRRKSAMAARPIPLDAIYVGRGTPWGNPFVMPKYDRASAITQFRRYALDRLAREPAWLEPLHGKSLVCWCYPLPCHADVLLDLANQRQEDMS